MAGIHCDELIDFRSPEKKCTNMPPCFTPLVPIPLMNISCCSSPLDFVNYGSNPFDQLIEQSNLNLEAKNDPFEMVCTTAFQTDTQEKCVFSPDKFGMKEYDQKKLVNTSVNLSRHVKEQFPDICASAMSIRRQVSGNFEICDNSNVDLISSTHRIIDLECEKLPNNCDAENFKSTLNSGMCFNSTTLSAKLLDLPSPEFEHIKNSEKIDTKYLCNKMNVSYSQETKSNFELNKDCIYTKKSLNRSFSSAEDQIFRPTNCIDSEKTVKDIVAERVEKCIQKALDDSRCYRTGSVTNLNSSYSVGKVKLHRRSYSSSSVRDAEFISWLGLDKSRIKHRKSDFNIDVEISKFNNQCISDIRNLNFKKSLIPFDRMDSYPKCSSNVQTSLVTLSDASPILGNNSIQEIGSYKSNEACGTDSFSQVIDMSDEVFFEANLISSAINGRTSVAGGCMYEDIQTIQAPWELPCAQSLASEDCDEEFGTKDTEEIQCEKTEFLHSTPLHVKGIFSSKNEKKILPASLFLTPMAKKQQKEPVRLFPHSEDAKKGPLKAIIPLVKMTKHQNTKGQLLRNTKADKLSPNIDMKSKKTPSPNNVSESLRIKHVEKSSQNSSLASDVKQCSSLRRIVSHGNITGSAGLKKSVQEAFHERSRSVDVKVDETKQTQKDYKAPRRVQSASNVMAAKKEMKAPFLKPLIRSSKIGAMQTTSSKVYPHLQQKVLPRLSNTTVSKSGKENITP